MTASRRVLDEVEPVPGWRCGVIRGLDDAAARVGTRGVGRLPTATTALVVLKVGGSLLSRPAWPALLVPLLAACGPRSCCLVVGGGAVVDGLRTLDRVAAQSPELMHTLAIDGMRLTARIVAEAIHLPLTAMPPDQGRVTVLDVPAWLAEGVRSASLPIGWGVTSDAIAARVAVEHGGSLLLAKSVPPPPCPGGVDPLATLAQAGWVDDHFPIAAGPLVTIEWAAPAA
jgi:hypothetical protein